MSTRQELARVDGPIRFADSMRTNRPGELVAVDPRGREVTTWGRFLLQCRLGLLYGVSLALPALLLEAIGVPFPVAAAGMLGLFFLGNLLVRRATLPYFHVQARLGAGDIAGAEALLASLRTPARGGRANQRLWLEGWIAYARGQLRRALDIFERLLPRLSRRHFFREAVQIVRIELYARVGEVARARALRGELPTPRSELMEISLASSDLQLAIGEGNEHTFADATIDRWVRLALELNNTSLLLATLAQVVATRGDHELADHLAREARDRFCWCPLASDPALAQWVDDRIARAGQPS